MHNNEEVGYIAKPKPFWFIHTFFNLYLFQACTKKARP